MGQPDVAGEFRDVVEHLGNHRVLSVSFDVMDTLLDGLLSSLSVLGYAMLVHPLLGIPLLLHMVLECIVRVSQELLLGSAVSEIHFHTSDGEESTENLNEDPSSVPAVFPEVLLWWGVWHCLSCSRQHRNLEGFQGRRA